MDEQLMKLYQQNDLRKKALKAIDDTTFYPARGKERIRSMIKTRPDWCISRQRIWGVPLPLFVSKKTKEPLKDFEIIENIAISGLVISGLPTITGTYSAANGQSLPEGFGFIAALALSILAYKGFTTITNQGGDIKNPHKNVGRSIIISIIVCTVIYVVLALSVAGGLSIEEIISPLIRKKVLTKKEILDEIMEIKQEESIWKLFNLPHTTLFYKEVGTKIPTDEGILLKSYPFWEGGTSF